jgi:hypothetical protein
MAATLRAVDVTGSLLIGSGHYCQCRRLSAEGSRITTVGRPSVVIDAEVW